MAKKNINYQYEKPINENYDPYFEVVKLLGIGLFSFAIMIILFLSITLLSSII